VSQASKNGEEEVGQSHSNCNREWSEESPSINVRRDRGQVNGSSGDTPQHAYKSKPLVKEERAMVLQGGAGVHLSSKEADAGDQEEDRSWHHARKGK